MRAGLSVSSAVLLTVVAAMPPNEARLAASAKAVAIPSVDICVNYPRTFDQRLQDEYKQAFAVFSGEVRMMTLSTVVLTVDQVWKGKLGTEVVMPTGVTDNNDGTLTSKSNAFSFVRGEKYVIFADGKDGNSLTASVCRPNVTMSEAHNTIAVLNQILKHNK